LFIHLGGDTVVSLKDVIVILNFDLDGHLTVTQEFLAYCQSKRQVVYISEETPKTVIVTKDKVYYSPISSITLKRRAMLTPGFENGIEINGD